jgi:hypothetical protein
MLRKKYNNKNVTEYDIGRKGRNEMGFPIERKLN